MAAYCAKSLTGIFGQDSIFDILKIILTKVSCYRLDTVCSHISEQSTTTFTVESMLTIFMCYTDLVGNNNNNIADCIFYLIKKSNQPEDGS